jgi:hypothetical protein
MAHNAEDLVEPHQMGDDRAREIGLGSRDRRHACGEPRSPSFAQETGCSGCVDEMVW